MSYSSARDKLVSIIEAITPSSGTVFPVGLKFQHMPAASGKNVTSRSFWLEANRDGPGVIRGPDLINLATPKHVVTMTLTVFYRDHGPRQDEFDAALESDRIDVAKALLNPSNWDWSTSKIENVVDGREFMRCQRFAVGTGTEMRFTFPLTHR